MGDHGPYYIPLGTTMEDIQRTAKLYRVAGNSVRMIKKPIKPNTVNKNTHEVWLKVKALY